MYWSVRSKIAPYTACALEPKTWNSLLKPVPLGTNHEARTKHTLITSDAILIGSTWSISHSRRGGSPHPGSATKDLDFPDKLDMARWNNQVIQPSISSRTATTAITGTRTEESDKIRVLLLE
jgi:hypothetical protein